MENTLETLNKIFMQMSPLFDEKLKRLFLGSCAIVFGHGGVLAVAKKMKMNRDTVAAGKKELLGREQEREVNAKTPRSANKIRKIGGGRKRIAKTDEALTEDLESLIEPLTCGNPESPLRWTCKSVRRLAYELNKMGHKVSSMTISRELKAMGYSLQGESVVF